MKAKQKENLEKILNKALELYEKEKPIPEILDLFSQHKDDLKEIFQTIEILAKRKKEILPSKEILRKILSQIPEVTETELTRYLNREKKSNFSVAKGRFSLIKIIKNYPMAMKWKIIIPLGVVAVIAIFLIANQFGNKAPTVVTTPSVSEQTSISESLVLPLATGKIDDVVTALLMDSSGEVNQVKDLDDDVNLIVFDGQAINDFLLSYNENEF